MEDDVDSATVINIRELDDVLMKDVGHKIAHSGRYARTCTKQHSHIYYIK